MPDPNELLALALRGGAGLIVSLQTRLRIDEVRPVMVGAVGGITYKGFILGESGRLELFEFRTASTAGGFEQTTRFALPPGWLVGVSVVLDEVGEPYGASFVRASLEVLYGTATIPVAALFSGYVTGRGGLSYPPVLNDTPDQVTGAPVVQAGTAPAAGANFLLSLVEVSIRRISFLGVRLVTDGTAAARSVLVRVTDGGNTAFETVHPTSQAAGTTVDYYFSDWGFQPVDFGSVRYGPLPQIGFQGDLGLRIVVQNIQLGDQLSRIEIGWDRAAFL